MEATKTEDMEEYKTRRKEVKNRKKKGQNKKLKSILERNTRKLQNKQYFFCKKE